MDIVLERILTLIPRKEDGEFVHGALKEFAESIGLKSGNLISDWIAGRSKSYKRKLHEISAKYGVSVEWLEGKTDKRERPSAQVSEGQIPGYNELSDENKAKAREYIALLLNSQHND